MLSWRCSCGPAHHDLGQRGGAEDHEGREAGQRMRVLVQDAADETRRERGEQPEQRELSGRGESGRVEQRAVRGRDGHPLRPLPGPWARSRHGLRGQREPDHGGQHQRLRHQIRQPQRRPRVLGQQAGQQRAEAEAAEVGGGRGDLGPRLGLAGPR